MSNEKHPADDIGRALLRAGGILSSVTICYNKDQGCFDLDNSFVFEALTAVETMLTQAGDALGRLYSDYDLSPIQPVTEKSAETEVAAEMKAEVPDDVVAEKAPVPLQPVEVAEPVIAAAAEPAITAVLAEEEALPPAHQEIEDVEDAVEPALLQMGYFPSSEQVLRLSQKLDTIIAGLQLKNPQARDEQAADDRAKSYLEFLDKLTAMADSAALEASRAGKQDKSLMPILDSLRADVMRLRDVA